MPVPGKMAPGRALRALLAALVVFAALVSARGTSTQRSTASTSAPATFATTFKPFPTKTDEFITSTVISPSANPTESEVGIFFPVRQGIDVNEGLSYIINITSAENNVALNCWYPISGNWGLLPRVLFYVTILAALILRHHQWLYAGALVASLTYSGVAAIQACLMVWRGPSFGDLDMIPLLSILGTSCILTVPLLNWSDTLRNIGKNENTSVKDARPHQPGERREQEFDAAARSIVLYWAFLVLVGFLCVFVAVVPLNFSLTPTFHNWSSLTYSGNTNVTCTPPGGTLDLNAGQAPDWDVLALTTEFLDTNGCVNPCSIPASENLGIFRSQGDLVPLDFLATLRLIVGDEVNKHQRVDDEFSSYYIKYGLLFLPYIFLQGIWASIFGRRTPGQARNIVYAFLTRVRLSRSRTPLDPAPPAQKTAAKIIAFLSYLWAVLILVLSVPLVILNVCAAEITMAHFASSEDNNHVGAWGPWASVAMALAAGMFARYHNEIGYLVALTAYKVVWLVSRPSQELFRCCTGSRKPAGSPDILSEKPEETRDRHTYWNTIKEIPLGAGEKALAFTIGRTSDVFHGLREELGQAIEFLRNPDLSRNNQGRIHRMQATACGCIIGCQCPRNWVPESCRHERGTCLEWRPCQHNPTCQHTQHCMETKKKAQRLRLLNPERKSIALALGPLHGGMLALDVTGTPIPIRPEKTEYRPVLFSQKPMPDSDSDGDGNSAGVSIPRWHDATHERHSMQYRGSLRRMLSRKSRYSRVSSIRPPPANTESDQATTTIHSQPMQTGAGRAGKTMASDKAVRVSEEAVHPLLRDSIMSHEGVSPKEEDDIAPPPRVKRKRLSQAEVSRRKSMAKDLPTIPQYVPKTPHSTPNYKTRSVASGDSAISPVATTNHVEPNTTWQDDVSPLRPSTKDTAQNSSSNITKRSTAQPSPESEEPGETSEEELDRVRYSTGLTSSFEHGIMSRHRRSQAYGPDILRERSRKASSSTAPIPVHMEEDDDFHPMLPIEAELPATSTPAGVQTLAPPFSDDADQDETTGSEWANAVLQAQPRPVRHISELVKLPTVERNSGAFLSPQERHAMLDPPSTCSTPPIALPTLSPPDPDSNVGQARFLGIQGHNPHLSLSGVVNRLHALDTPSADAPIPRSGGPGILDIEAPRTSNPEGLAGIEHAIRRNKSPRPPGYRSTVDYLQVHRPTTVVYADEITLRKDESGVYQLVINGNEIVHPPPTAALRGNDATANTPTENK